MPPDDDTDVGLANDLFRALRDEVRASDRARRLRRQLARARRSLERARVPWRAIA